jgi:uncharacterized protein YcbX
VGSTISVAGIARYPVKSMLGESLDVARVGIQGIAGDRAWALRDDVRNGLTNAKRFAALMAMRARFLAEPDLENRSPTVEIRDAEGAATRSDAPDVAAWLTARLGHPVSIWPLLPAEHDAHYRREAPAPDADVVAGLREMFARTPDEPLPDLAAFPPVLASHSSPPGTYFDAYPLLILSRSALAALEGRARAAGSASVFDLRRFRPNLLVDCSEEGFVEDAWVGRELRIGTVRARVEMRCPRCIMTTHGFLDVPRDPRVMRSLVRHHGGDLGVYASVIEPGEIRTGDAVEVL